MEPTTPRWRLLDEDYETALLGKYVNDYDKALLTGEPYVPPGWDRWYGTAVGNSWRFNDWFGETNFQIGQAGQEEYFTYVVADKGEEFLLDPERGRPFFVWLSFYAPHAITRPAPDREEACPDSDVDHSKPSFNEADVSDKPYEIRKLRLLTDGGTVQVDRRDSLRACELEAVDRRVGELLQLLEDNGELNNTLVIFTSDNGFSLGEHRRGAGRSASTRSASESLCSFAILR